MGSCRTHSCSREQCLQHFVDRHIATSHYRQPTELQEVNVFCRVCLSVQRRIPQVTITHDALDLTAKEHPPHPIPSRPRCPWTLDLGRPLPQPQHHLLSYQPQAHAQTLDPAPPASDIWWSSLETCSNLFIGTPLPQSDI